MTNPLLLLASLRSSFARRRLDGIVSSLIELCHSLMQSKTGGQFKRQSMAYSTLLAVMDKPTGGEVFLTNSGFEAGVCTLARLSGAFEADANTNADGDFDVLVSVLTLFAKVMEQNLPARHYFNQNITYSSLSSTILATKVFDNQAYTEAAAFLVFNMILQSEKSNTTREKVSACEPRSKEPVVARLILCCSSLRLLRGSYQKCVESFAAICSSMSEHIISNADAVKLLFHLAPSLPRELALKCLDILTTLTTRLHQSLTSSSLVHSLTHDFDHILSDPSHPLQTQYFNILYNLSSRHMTCADFKSLMTSIASPCLADANSRLELPIIWAASEPSTPPSLTKHREENAKEFEARIKNLTSIASSSDSVPYATVGGTVANSPLPPTTDPHPDNKDASFLCVATLCRPSSSLKNPLDKQRESSTPFPASSGFSFSVWLSVPSDADLPLPILALAPSSAATSSEFLALRYFQGRFTVMTSTALSTPLTNSLTVLKPNTWHHITFTYNPPKRLLSKKATVNIHLNAVPSSDTTIHSVSFPSLEGTQCFIGHPAAKDKEEVRTCES